MRKHLLIFSWEYLGHHSEQGTALSKRPRQVAESYNRNGWEVTVIHKDHGNESKEAAFVSNREDSGIRRVSVKQGENIGYTGKRGVQRRLETLYYVAFRGDRTFKWADDVIRNFDKFGVEQPDLIISFFTPRVTLFLGDHFSGKLKCRWIADLQDPVFEGISKSLQPFCRRWMKNVLRSAHAVVHVSPEWGSIDAALVDKKISVIRHAIPDDAVKPNTEVQLEFIDKDSSTFNIFYGDSIDPNIQSLDVLKDVIASVRATGVDIQLLLAGNKSAYDFFRQELGEEVVKHLGWLSAEVLSRYIFNCNCTLVIPWSRERVGIPSKFYELCSYPKPIWIIGNDLGAFNSLLNEWKHPAIGTDNLYYQKNAIKAAVKGDYQFMFNMRNCKGKCIRIADLYGEYMRLV